MFMLLTWELQLETSCSWSLCFLGQPMHSHNPWRFPCACLKMNLPVQRVGKTEYQFPSPKAFPTACVPASAVASSPSSCQLGTPISSQPCIQGIHPLESDGRCPSQSQSLSLFPSYPGLISILSFLGWSETFYLHLSPSPISPSTPTCPM